MLPLTVRRAVSSAPQTAGLASSLASSAAASKSAAAITVSTPLLRCNQRRFSSSKSSRSDNESNNGISAGQSMPAASSSRRADGRSANEKRRRRAKDLAEKADLFENLPSVPSTQHLSQEALGLSSFFSLHRPISVTQTMPRTVTDEHFASIFASTTTESKIADTMNTLSNTIGQLEGPMAQMSIGQSESDGSQRIDFKAADGSESTAYLQIDAMAGDFLPFHPPPAPSPEHLADSKPVGKEESEWEDVPNRTYKAVFTIEEHTAADGEVRLLAHSPKIFQNARAQKSGRQFANGRPGLYAISVKRQRKLRMKKKKYKKLMKRTRNERRKLDRT